MFIVVVAGCGITPPKVPTVSDESTTQQSRLANRGVVLKFIEDKPPQNEIFLNDNFRIKVKLENYNEKPISGEVYLSDIFDGANLQAIPGKRSKTFDVPGVDKELRGTPGEQEIDFGEFVYTNPDLHNQRTSFTAEVQYYFDEQFSTSMCIKSEEAIVSSSQCTNKRSFSSNDLGSQYAPVTVTSIRQDMNSINNVAKIKLFLTFQDFGGSFGGINNQDNSIDISNAVELAGKGIFNCNPKQLSFNKNIKKREAICRLDVALPDNNYFQNPLIIRLSYFYKNTLHTNQIPITDLDKKFEVGLS
jgi:hypothetical protein|tara:strand:- start:64 stop:972 length:909 start_codon:yes stop_codon:yes gene_type:complete